MKTRMLHTKVRNVFMAACTVLWCFFVSCANGVEPGTDLCQIVTGKSVAQAVRGQIVETKSAEGRCVYIVAFPEGGAKNRAFVVYRHEASAYEGLREAQAGEVTQVAGLGDEAVMTFDRETKRYWLLVVKRGRVILQVSGDDKDQVRQVAAAALLKFTEK